MEEDQNVNYHGICSVFTTYLLPVSARLNALQPETQTWTLAEYKKIKDRPPAMAERAGKGIPNVQSDDIFRLFFFPPFFHNPAPRNPLRPQTTSSYPQTTKN